VRKAADVCVVVEEAEEARLRDADGQSTQEKAHVH
jgi:hypothetical protein